MIFRYVAVTLTILLAGCANAVSYHHAERVGLSLEVKTTEPQQPLQGTFGLKTRTVLVAPGLSNSNDPLTQTDETKQRDTDHVNQVDIGPLTTEENKSYGESTSVISDFNLERKTEGFFGRTILESAFITGNAAIVAPEASSAALAGLGVGGIDDAAVYRSQILDNFYSILKAMAADGDAEAAEYVKDLDALAKMLPDLRQNDYYAITGSNLTVKKGYSLSPNFPGVLQYDMLLAGNLAAITAMEEDRAITLDAAVIDATALQKIMRDKARLQKERKDFYTQIGSSAAIDRAGNYVLNGM